MNAAVIEKAKTLAKSGFVPIPLKGKVPQLVGWQQVPQIAPETIDEWVAKGLIENVGLRCGDRGLVVLDFDGMDGYERFVEDFAELADTYTVATGSGDGMHLYYHVTGELPRSRPFKLPSSKGEVRAKGMQVVVPPSVHPDTGALYTVHNKTPAKELSNFEAINAWIEQFQPRYEPTKHEIDGSAPLANGNAIHYAKAALQNMVAELARMTNVEDDYQNTTLNITAWKLAHFVGRGDLTRTEVYAACEGAMQSNGYISHFGHKAFEKTFESGFRTGMADNQYVPKVYNQPPTQSAVRRELPGERAYQPPQMARDEQGVTTIGRTRIVRRDSLFSDLTARVMDPDYLPGAPPMIFPLRCLHGLGGQARVTKAGKLIGIVGASGSGKTSALETIVDAYVAADVPCWMWTPEWTPDEMAERVMQRYGGPTQDELYLHEINKWRVKTFGTPSSLADDLSFDQRQNAMKAIKTVRGWAGDVSFIENSLLTVNEMAELIAAAKGVVTPFPQVLIVDYAQLLKANEVDEKDDTSMYNMIQRFKTLCVYHGLVGILATQTTKEQAKLQGREGKFLGTTVVNCTKNSRGRQGKVRVKSDPEHLRLVDEHYPNQVFSSDDHYLGSQAGRFINDDAFNLWLTLNPEYEEVV